MAKNKLANWILISVILIGISACSPASPQPEATPTAGAPTRPPTVQPTRTPQVSPTPETPRGTISIWHSWNESQMPALESMLKDFQERFPEVSFDVLYVPYENLKARYQTALQESTGPDILLAPAQWGPELYDSNWVANLNDLVSPDVLRAQNQPALEAVTYKDRLIGLPYALEGVILLRNKTIIARAAPTFGEFVTLAKSATQGEIIGANLEQSFFFSGGHLDGTGGELMDTEGNPAFNDARGLAWIELLQAFNQAGPTETLTDEDLNRFKEGRVGWIIDGTWNIDSLAEAIGRENLAIDPWPSYRDGSLSGYIQPSVLYLNPQSPAEERLAAGAFLEYFVSPEAQSLLSAVGLIPAASGVRITDPIRETLINEAMTALAGGTAYPTHPLMPVYLTPMEQALQAILQAGIPASEAFQAAEETILREIERFSATTTPSP